MMEYFSFKFQIVWADSTTSQHDGYIKMPSDDFDIDKADRLIREKYKNYKIYKVLVSYYTEISYEEYKKECDIAIHDRSFENKEVNWDMLEKLYK